MAEETGGMQDWAARRTKSGGAEVVPDAEMEGDSSEVHTVLTEQSHAVGDIVEALDELPDPDEAIIEIRNDCQSIRDRLDAKAKELGAQPEEEQNEDTSSEEIDTNE
jgi:hypothetical protein